MQNANFQCKSYINWKSDGGKKLSTITKNWQKYWHIFGIPCSCYHNIFIVSLPRHLFLVLTDSDLIKSISYSNVKSVRHFVRPYTYRNVVTNLTAQWFVELEDSAQWIKMSQVPVLSFCLFLLNSICECEVKLAKDPNVFVLSVNEIRDENFITIIRNNFSN